MHIYKTSFPILSQFRTLTYANYFILLECLQNAYNLGITINPQGINSCPSPSCFIPNITNFCQAPNTLTGPLGDGCYNTDGPNVTSPTLGTLAFADACPEVMSYTTDTTGTVFECPTGSNYEIVFSCSQIAKKKSGHQCKGVIIKGVWYIQLFANQCAVLSRYAVHAIA